MTSTNEDEHARLYQQGKYRSCDGRVPSHIEITSSRAGRNGVELEGVRHLHDGKGGVRRVVLLFKFDEIARVHIEHLDFGETFYGISVKDQWTFFYTKEGNATRLTEALRVEVAKPSMW